MTPVPPGLIHDLRSGDPAALDRAYRLWSDRVFSYAASILGDGDAAEDIVQETFMKLPASIHSLESDDAFLSWLFRITRNECLMLLRKRHRNGTVDENAVWDGESPLERVERDDMNAIVRELLRRLRPEYREVLLLREYEELSYAEIADLTGATESSVKSRIFRAREALTEAMKRRGE
ncbi:MAG: hypothetical protein A2X67_11070 [Ignavibacteria bacterium GWA2_55_11]|nr:MAG: hypothetical protein A2X67_11070 [Ignavibacteria bacterium GWA2_55_11]OGU46015.1 MAG: hypothetical protein A2X68_10815 [Ignavibacteria bacterium GWC2_56_12]OGU67544.1 MAG: hypothetical protein A3C56_08365 [Ignavibacteria bacterium RIFCSPHIGHO2_02_FULL_56_12]OGU70282.1 MAG: hypothetical protein A3H45_12350 [Ignavibacteria bacterium RIFCSPLOWO2_02_FULL_55_14]OGU75135.1 MAG: hypothetical protein A3G43_12620 [Ignavibacteria bacterium RIFCSPLOWO2_12_FULL_56_21]HAV24056.1 hypothetical protei